MSSLMKELQRRRYMKAIQKPVFPIPKVWSVEACINRLERHFNLDSTVEQIRFIGLEEVQIAWWEQLDAWFELEQRKFAGTEDFEAEHNKKALDALSDCYRNTLTAWAKYFSGDVDAPPLQQQEPDPFAALDAEPDPFAILDEEGQ